jgi:hypothetical protein
MQARSGVARDAAPGLPRDGGKWHGSGIRHI